MKFFKALTNAYVYAAVILLNTIVAFLCVNWLTGLYLEHAAKEKVITENKVMAKYKNIFSDKEMLAKIYPGMTEAQIRAMLDESWNRDFVYRPWAMYGEQPITGEYVTVDPAGFRAVANQGPWPPSRDNYNIFLFGGSTLFGYGLPGGQTVADHLQEALDALPSRKPCKVYNFGAGTYYSTQERIFYQNLLAQGFVPDAAVFLDGFNDPQRQEDAPWNSERFRQMMESSARHTGAWEEIHINWLKTKIIHYLPITEKLFDLERLMPSKALLGEKDKAAVSTQLAVRQIERFAANKKLVDAASKAFGARDLYVWQPASKYDADTLAINPFTTEDDAQLTYLYAQAEKRYKDGEFGDNFVWCADILKGRQDVLYVDSAHYGNTLSKMCADCMLRGMRKTGLLAPVLEEAAPGETPAPAAAGTPAS